MQLTFEQIQKMQDVPDNDFGNMERELTMQQAQEMMAKNEGGLCLYGKDFTVLPDGLTVHGELDLRETKIKALPQNLTVSSYLNLCYTPITELPQDLKLGDALFLSSSAIRSLPDGLVVPGDLYLRSTRIESLPKGLLIGGSLDLAKSKIRSLPEDLVVPGNLDLSHTDISWLPSGLIVGGDLRLESSKITSLPEDLIVGGSVSVSFLGPIELSSLDNVKRMQEGEFVRDKYLFCDGMLTLIKETKKVGKYTLYAGELTGRNVVSDGEFYARCTTSHNGVADVLYRRVKDSGTNRYKGVTLDTQMPIPELAVMYRILTGASKWEVYLLIEELQSLNKKCTVRDAVELTKGQYNATVFEKFFVR